MVDKSPLFSIITVCFNAERTIRDTIESVCFQSFTDYEYIIVDGKSEDSTLEIAESYTESFRNKSINYFIISENDNGIYDAMNKGVQLSTGKYLIFMNSDDSFFNNCVLSLVGNECYKKGLPDIIVGCTHIIGDDRDYIQSPHRFLFKTKMLGRMPFIHQSAFCKRELLVHNPFSLNYRFASDYDFFLGQLFQNRKFHIMNDIISNYSRGGISSNVDVDRVYNEYSLIRKANIRRYKPNMIRRIQIFLSASYYFIRMKISTYTQISRLFFLKHEK